MIQPAPVTLLLCPPTMHLREPLIPYPLRICREETGCTAPVILALAQLTLIAVSVRISPVDAELIKRLHVPAFRAPLIVHNSIVTGGDASLHP